MGAPASTSGDAVGAAATRAICKRMRRGISAKTPHGGSIASPRNIIGGSTRDAHIASLLPRVNVIIAHGALKRAWRAHRAADE